MCRPRVVSGLWTGTSNELMRPSSRPWSDAYHHRVPFRNKAALASGVSVSDRGSSSQAEAPGAQNQLLQGLTQLLAPVGVDERVDERVTDDQDEEEVEICKVTITEGVGGAGEDEDEVEEEGTPAQNEHTQEDGERDGSLHAGGLTSVFVESHDASGVHVRQEEHVQVQDGVEHQGGAEEGDQAHDDGVVSVVDDEEGAGGDAGAPHHHDDGDGPLRGHDAVVPQRVEDGDVAVRGDGAKEGEGGHHRAADHHVNHVVQVAQHARVHVQKAVVIEEHEHGLHHITDTDQHVGHGQAADEVVHGGVQVSVLHDGQDHQDVFHQADNSQSEEELLGDADLHAAQRVLISVGYVGFIVLHEFY